MAAISSASIGDKWEDPAAIQAWFDEPHQKTFKRPYNAELIARLRDPAGTSSTGNAQAIKLRALFAKHQKTGGSSLALGATDPITAHLMAESGLEVLYVSGAASSQTDTPTFDVGADLADYPYDTVPRKVKQIFRSQLLHYRVDKTREFNGTLPQKVDRLTPMIADGDSGHGQSTSNMKLTKAFVEAGVAGFHIDDLFTGVKEFALNKLNDHVIVPVSEHIRRLLACKLQLDIMGSEVMLIHRTDAETSCWLTSTIDPRDRPFILGSSNASLDKTLVDVYDEKGDMDAWLKDAELLCIDDAIKKQVSAELYEKYMEATKGMNVTAAWKWATKNEYDFYWECDAARAPEGWYRYRGDIDSAIMRAVACAEYVDMVWSMAGRYDPARRLKFSEECTKQIPGKLMVYNWSGPYLMGNPTDEELLNFHKETAAQGYVFQMMPLAGPKGLSVGVKRFTNAVATKGLLGYTEEESRAAAKIEGGVSVLGWYAQMGQMSDAMVNAIKI
ncbi:isocitrate lyase [Pseudohyphozyma bogoriensis]|nr:isocitrate lyase [Pseudohyphozyma bogoriensis]